MRILDIAELLLLAALMYAIAAPYIQQNLAGVSPLVVYRLT